MKLSQHDATISANSVSINAQGAKLSEHESLISANNTAIANEANARISDIARESAARLALSNTISGLQTTITSGVSSVGSTLNKGNIIIGNGNNIASAVAISGDVSIDELGVTTIGAGKIRNGMLAAGSVNLETNVTGILPLANLPGDLSSKVGAATNSTPGILSSTDWNLFNAKQSALSVTTTGTSGAASFSNSTLNIPNYTTYIDNSVASKASLASPDFTGTPTAPTATAGTKTTQIATTAFVDAAVTLKAPLASPDLTGTPTAPTATAGTKTTQIATTAFVDAAVIANTAYTTDAASTGDVLIKTANGSTWATLVYETKSRPSNPASGTKYDFTLTDTPLSGTIVKVYFNGSKQRNSYVSVNSKIVSIDTGNSLSSGTYEFEYYK
jgi:hypothetical protein